MTDGVATAGTWSLEIAGTLHIVRLVANGAPIEAPRSSLGITRSEPPTAFQVDDTILPLTPTIRAHVADFDLAGRQATLTVSLVKPSFWGAFRRAPGPAMSRALSPGQRGSIGPLLERVLRWTLYRLDVDGAARGTWVRSFQGRWAFVDQGGALPQPDRPWPSVLS